MNDKKQSNDKNQSNAKIAIWSAVIAGVVTVLTSFIGIVPKMRQSDKQELQDYQKQIEQLKQRIAKADNYAITGYVRTNKNKPLADAMLVAAPAGNSATLDDQGKFYFSRMASQPYFIVVQNQSGQMRRVLIDPTVAQPADTDDLAITYTFSQVPQK